MAETGTIETGMPLEAIRMELTGQLKDHYDVYYSVFQNGSWTAPVKNGETAGTEGQGLRVDGIWVTVTEKMQQLRRDRRMEELIQQDRWWR